VPGKFLHEEVSRDGTETQRSLVSVRKMPHITHKGGLREASHVQKFYKQAGWPRRKMAQQLFSAGLALSSIWEKARARDRQREVAGDKGQWGFVLQGMRPAAEARSRGGQRKVAGDKEQWALFCKG
jgi:hypothetical protein